MLICIAQKNIELGFMAENCRGCKADLVSEVILKISEMVNTQICHPEIWIGIHEEID